LPENKQVEKEMDEAYMHGHSIENINEEPPAMLVDSFLK